MAADVVLSNGQEITFDLNKVTYRQWKGIWSSSESDEDSDVTIARCAGITPEELNELSWLDFRQLLSALNQKGTKPLSAPNSPRASTSD